MKDINPAPKNPKQKPKPNRPAQNTTDSVRHIVVDHPEQTIQLIKHWLKD